MTSQQYLINIALVMQMLLAYCLNMEKWCFSAFIRDVCMSRLLTFCSLPVTAKKICSYPLLFT